MLELMKTWKVLFNLRRWHEFEGVGAVEDWPAFSELGGLQRTNSGKTLVDLNSHSISSGNVWASIYLAAHEEAS